MIELRGHTDDVGSLESNQRLSEERARNVAKFLMLRGVTADKIKVVGYGKTQPLANNSTEEGRALNRRVEIRFVR